MHTPVYTDSPAHVTTELERNEQLFILLFCPFQRVMKRIVKRYIFDMQRESDTNEGKCFRKKGENVIIFKRV